VHLLPTFGVAAFAPPIEAAPTMRVRARSMPNERFMTRFFCLFINTAKPKIGIPTEGKARLGLSKSAKSGLISSDKPPEISPWW